MPARALVYKSQSAQQLADGRWSLDVWALFADDTGVLVTPNPQQVNVEIDPLQPATWKPAITASVVARGLELGLDVLVTFSPVFG